MNDFPNTGTGTADKASSPYYVMLEQFLKLYPPVAGWGRVSTPVAPEVVLPGIQTDYERYLDQCRADQVVPRKLCAFRSQLFNPAGNLIVQVHAIRFADSMGDVMACETKAFGRMLRHLGFVYEEDETSDLDVLTTALTTAARNAEVLVPKLELPAAPPPAPQSDDAPPGNPLEDPQQQLAEQSQTADDKPQQPGPQSAAAPQAKATRPSFKPSRQVPADAQASDGGVPPAMLRQVEQLQKTKGVAIKAPATIEEARAMLKELAATKK